MAGRQKVDLEAAVTAHNEVLQSHAKAIASMQARLALTTMVAIDAVQKGAIRTMSPETKEGMRRAIAAARMFNEQAADLGGMSDLIDLFELELSL